jgi:hypothetical protein
MFAPPFGPPDFMGSASGINDSALFRGTECPAEAGQCGLDKPRFERDPCGLAVRIEFRGHAQRLKRRCDAPGGHTHHHDGADPRLAYALPFSGFLDHGQGCAGCSAVAFKPAFCELEQEGLGRRNAALGSSFADGHHLA